MHTYPVGTHVMYSAMIGTVLATVVAHVDEGYTLRTHCNQITVTVPFVNIIAAHYSFR